MIETTNNQKPKRKLSVRRRLEDYYYFVLETGRINRNDVMRIGEVSLPQSSADIAMLIEGYPYLGLVYDKSLKCYRAQENACIAKKGRKRND